MKPSQTNTPTAPALLCIESGSDTPVKNSLCCAATGVIKAFRATAGVLIPHVKLRRAARVDATLNAQNRPLAQLVVGYGHQTISIESLSAANVQAVEL